MSAVTNVVLCTSVVEAPDDSGRPGPNWDRVQAWLGEHGPWLRHVDHCASGPKAMEMTVAIGAYNYLPVAAFAAFVTSLPWEEPSNVVLVVQPQEGETLVFRPSAR